MIERITTIDGFASLKDEWDNLLQSSSSNCVFLTWEWLFTWWKHLAEGRDLFILTVRNGERLSAIAPFALSSPRLQLLLPFRWLEFLGTGEVGSDYLDLIVRPGEEQEVWRELSEYLSSYKQTLKLEHLSIEKSLMGDFYSSLAARGWEFFQAKQSLSPYIDLVGHSWDSYLATLGSEHRYNFKRRLKNLEKRFQIRFDTPHTEEQRREAFSKLVNLHQKRWQETGETGAFCEPALLSFHEEMTQTALDRGWLRLFVLSLDETPVATIYGFRYGDTFYFYQSGFDTDYRKWSVGLVIMGLAIKSALEEGVREFDLLYGTESYKFLWASRSRNIGRMEIYPPSIVGRCHQRMQQAMIWLRAGKRFAREVLLQPASGTK